MRSFNECFLLPVSCCTWLYVACLNTATGDGDVIMQFCPCFHIVQKMKEGSSVGVACSEVVGNMAAQCGEALEVGVVALDMKVRQRV